MRILPCLVVGAIVASLPAYGSRTEPLPGRFVFSSQLSTPNLGQLYTERADGTDLRKLTPAGFGETETDPAWSPDGSRIAYAAAHPCRRAPLGYCFAIWVANDDGSGRRRLTPYRLPGRYSKRAVSFYEPTWSPDGHRLAFTRTFEATDKSALYVMDADGTRMHRLIRLHDSAEPDWSPDGTKIVFSHGYGTTDLFVFDLAKRSSKRLTTTRADELAPRWSPDGSRIAYQRWTSPASTVFVIRADGTGRVNLSRRADSDGTPAWSPDGSMVAFNSERGSTTGIYVVAADGSGRALRVRAPEIEADAIDWRSEP